MKTPQAHLHRQADLIEALHSAGRVALILLACATVLVIASSALNAALALPETLTAAPRW